MKAEREINIFSISFLDAFCNALGAMILLFILNSQALSRSVQSAVEKYRVKAVEAEQEKREAVFAREDARRARDEAQRERDLAREARNTAEKAEQKASEHRVLASMAERLAQDQKELAQKSEKDARTAEQKAIIALEETRQAKTRLEELNQELARKNEEILRSLQNLKQALARQKALQEVVAKNESLSRDAKALEERSQKLQQSLDTLEIQKKVLQDERDRFSRWYQEAKEQLTTLKGKYQDSVEEKNNLNTRLRSKEQELREKEAALNIKEEEIRKREAEMAARELKMEALQDELVKKDERSLFGIKLSYQRIVFLFDRSGSIVQNDWKKVIIDTCKEVLQNCEVEEFAVIAFSSEMLFFPGQRGLMLGGSRDNKQKAIDWLANKLEFGGNTHVHEALKIAYEEYGKLDAIFLVTDGLPCAYNYSTDALIREVVRYTQAQVQKQVATKIITIAIGYPPTEVQQFAEIYKYLHTISDITGGQYLGR